MQVDLQRSCTELKFSYLGTDGGFVGVFFFWVAVVFFRDQKRTRKKLTKFDMQ